MPRMCFPSYLEGFLLFPLSIPSIYQTLFPSHTHSHTSKATAADWMSGASFVGMAGSIYHSGFQVCACECVCVWRCLCGCNCVSTRARYLKFKFEHTHFPLFPSSQGLAYIVGWTGGFCLVAILIAPFLRKFGCYTVPDFFASRYRHRLEIRDGVRVYVGWMECGSE